MGLTEKKGIYYAVTKYKGSDGKWKTKFISTKIKVSDHRKKEAKEIAAKLIADFKPAVHYNLDHYATSLKSNRSS